MNDDPIIHVWLTQYALTQGIYEADAEHCLSSCPEGRMVSVRNCGWGWCAHGEGKDWHRTLEGAKARVEEMRKKKITSLKASLKRMEKLEIKVKPLDKK